MPATWRTFGALWLREAQTGRELLEDAVEDHRALADLGELPSILWYRAVDNAGTDAWARAAVDYSEAISLAREFGQTTVLTMGLAGMARVEGRSGREESCRAHAAEALALSAQRNIRMARAWSDLALGDLELAVGRAEAAVAAYARIDEWLAAPGILDPDLSPGPDRLEALLRVDRGDEAGLVAVDYAPPGTAEGPALGAGQGCPRARIGLRRRGSRPTLRRRAGAACHHAGPVRGGEVAAGVRLACAGHAAESGPPAPAGGARRVRAPGRPIVGGAGRGRADGHRLDRAPARHR